MSLDLESGFDCNISEQNFHHALAGASRKLCGSIPKQNQNALALQKILHDYLKGLTPTGLRRIFTFKTIQNTLERLFASAAIVSIEIDDGAWNTILVAITFALTEVGGQASDMVILIGVRLVPQGNNKWVYEWTYNESQKTNPSLVREVFVEKLAKDIADAMHSQNVATLPFSSLDELNPKPWKTGFHR